MTMSAASSSSKKRSVIHFAIALARYLLPWNLSFVIKATAAPLYARGEKARSNSIS